MTSMPPPDARATSTAPAQAATAPGLSFGLTMAMAVATGVGVANIYYNQPLIGIIEHDLPGLVTKMIPTATQLGYAAGLFLLVPLGDLLERRRLIALLFALLAVSLVGAAMAPGAGLLLLASLAVGATSTVAQQIVPFAAHLSAPERRGRSVGTVMAGLLCGILLSRTLAGFVGSHAGWRAMFWISVPMALGAGALMAWRLPTARPKPTMGYGRLLGSMAALWREFPELRRASLTQALLFATFSIFWTVLALRLQEPRFALGADVAGLFGIVGAVGILAAPMAGRIADRRGPRDVILLGAGLTLVSWLIFGLWLSLAGLIVGVMLLDFAVQSVLVSNQHIVYALRPDARARLNTIFMGTMFLGGSAGSAVAMAVWDRLGWTGVTLIGSGLAAAAVALQMRARRGEARR